jgi:mitochondrial import inner membrane translocase subunit TIM44
MLDDEIPVLVVGFRTQEILAFRDPKTGEVVAGSDDTVDQCGYVAVMTRKAEELDNEITGGWKIVDVSDSLVYSQS